MCSERKAGRLAAIPRKPQFFENRVECLGINALRSLNHPSGEWHEALNRVPIPGKKKLTHLAAARVLEGQVDLTPHTEEFFTSDVRLIRPEHLVVRVHRTQ